MVVDSIVAAYAAPWAIALARRHPVVALVHQPPGGMEGGRLRKLSQGFLDRALYRRAATAIAASESLVEDLVAAGVPEEHVVLVPPGADDRPLASAPATSAPRRPRAASDLRGGRRAALLAAGAWVPRKGILELLDAFARLPPPAATLHLAGDTTADRRYGGRVRRRLAAGDLAGRVVVHGVVPPSELRALYQGADAFVLASTVEPYGTVYGEALAAGLPVIGWRAGNLPHLIEEGREGVMVRARGHRRPQPGAAGGEHGRGAAPPDGDRRRRPRRPPPPVGRHHLVVLRHPARRRVGADGMSSAPGGIKSGQLEL